MARLSNNDMAASFEEYADLLELDGANSFRTRAYRNAAQTLQQTVESVAEVAITSPDKLTDYTGIGADLAKKIIQLAETGTFTQLLEMREKFPPGVIMMLRVPGLGPKKVAMLFTELKIDSIAALTAQAEAGLISQLKGFGKKTEQTILAGLRNFQSTEQRLYLADIEPLAQHILDQLKQVKGVTNGAIAGSARRGKETVGDLDLLITTDNSKPVMDRLAELPDVAEVLARGETKMRVRLKPIINCYTPGGNRIAIEMDLRVVPHDSFGAAMQYFTGSKEHNVVLRQKAKEHGWSLNEYGLTAGEKVIASKTEQEIYQALGVPLIPPELRENRYEWDYLTDKDIPKLIEVTDIKGDLHMHTTATDGAGTIAEMIEGAISRGLEYIAITDHSKRVQIARGLDADRLRAHWDDIRKVSSKYKEIKVLCGVECDILENAEMDLDDQVLAEADWVIAVLHFGLSQPQDVIMQRLMHAIQHPSVDAVGHLTGRYIQKRAGAEMDVPAILKAAKEHRVMLEINAHPARLDMNDINAGLARSMGIPIIIDTDAHHVNGFDVLPWGIRQARRAGLTAKDVANTRPWKEFQKLIRRHL
jgi:DNA polymerase (family 10)